MLHQEITSQILSCYYKVHTNLGFGFLEKVYENALFLELKKAGLSCRKQFPIKVFYFDSIVGEYFADIVVQDCVIIELKACECIIEEHEFQLINYLKATKIEVGLLLNFGIKPEVRRKIFSNDLKGARDIYNSQ